MTSLSFRNVLVACAAVALVGVAIPNFTRLSAVTRSPALSTVAPSAQELAPTEAVPLQDSSCGDGRCRPPEDCNTCARDCGSCCGDRRCAPPEDCRSCPGDCGPC